MFNSDLYKILGPCIGALLAKSENLTICQGYSRKGISDLFNFPWIDINGSQIYFNEQEMKFEIKFLHNSIKYTIFL